MSRVMSQDNLYEFFKHRFKGLHHRIFQTIYDGMLGEIFEVIYGGILRDSLGWNFYTEQ